MGALYLAIYGDKDTHARAFHTAKKAYAALWDDINEKREERITIRGRGTHISGGEAMTPQEAEYLEELKKTNTFLRAQIDGYKKTLSVEFARRKDNLVPFEDRLCLIGAVILYALADILNSPKGVDWARNLVKVAKGMKEIQDLLPDDIKNVEGWHE